MSSPEAGCYNPSEVVSSEAAQCSKDTIPRTRSAPPREASSPVELPAVKVLSSDDLLHNTNQNPSFSQTSSLRSSPLCSFVDSPEAPNVENGDDPPGQWPTQLDAIEFERSAGRHRSHPSIAIIQEDSVDLDIDSVLTPRGPVDGYDRHEISRAYGTLPVANSMNHPHLNAHAAGAGVLKSLTLPHSHNAMRETDRMVNNKNNKPAPTNHSQVNGDSNGLSSDRPSLSLNMMSLRRDLAANYSGDGSRFLSPNGRPHTERGTFSSENNLFHSPCSTFAASEDAVQNTTYDAAASKHSAVTIGYYEDPYCQFFVKRPVKRSPLINRGYYARVAGVRKVVARFFKCIPAHTQVQVVNLGAGLDTTFFWLNDWVDANRDWCMFEVDFPEVTCKKRMIVMKNERLWKKLADQQEDIVLTADGTCIRSQKLRMVAVDIRRIEDMQEDLLTAGFRSDLPTLFLCECVLVYMQSFHSNSVLRWASNAVSAPSCIATYEQMNPHDAFGRTMVKNLEARGCPLLGIYDYPTLESQRRRYKDMGWDCCEIVDMNDVYDVHLDRREVMKIQRLELFDEIEEWRLIQGHYFIAVSLKGLNDSTEAVGSEMATDQATDEADDSSQSRSTIRDLAFLKPMTSIWSEHKHDEMPRFTTEEIRQQSTCNQPSFRAE